MEIKSLRITKELLERELTPEEADYIEKNIYAPALASSCFQSKLNAWTVWSMLNNAETKRRKKGESKTS